MATTLYSVVHLVGSLLVSSILNTRGAMGTAFMVANSCKFTIWPGILSNAGQELLENGGFTLQPGQIRTIDAPADWAGRIWGRAGCTFDSAGTGQCASGDCGGRLQCAGAGAEPPATLAEFSLQGAGASQDYYDVSLVDGYNLPMSVTPQRQDKSSASDASSASSSVTSCGTASCNANLTSSCPSALRVVQQSTGDVVSCMSACLAFQSAEYCCAGAYANPNTCKPTSYSEFFKAACPTAYSYAYDDPTSIFTCSGMIRSYLITFCPDTSSSSNLMNSQAWDAGARSDSGSPFLRLRPPTSSFFVMWAVLLFFLVL